MKRGDLTVAPPPLDASKCDVCQKPFLDIEHECYTCWARRGAPNVLLANGEGEHDALSARVNAVIEQAKRCGTYEKLLEFARAAQGSAAVVNVPLLYACGFFSSDRDLYSSYLHQVQGSVRRAATPEHERHRLAVDSILFGRYGRDIRFGALSLDGKGPPSYGPVSLELTNDAIRLRASVLEENSFSFVRRHGIRAGGPSAPKGFRATWATRHLLVLAKLGPELGSHTKPEDFPRLLLNPGTNREEDDFVEVHIFGTFDIRAVRRVILTHGQDASETDVDMRRLKEYLNNRRIPWEAR